MVLSRRKMEIAMARAQLNLSEFVIESQIPYSTVKNALYGRSVKPRTAGLIAAALGVDVTEILESEE